MLTDCLWRYWNFLSIIQISLWDFQVVRPLRGASKIYWYQSKTEMEQALLDKTGILFIQLLETDSHFSVQDNFVAVPNTSPAIALAQVSIEPPCIFYLSGSCNIC
jgi:hypothetical protein